MFFTLLFSAAFSLSAFATTESSVQWEDYWTDAAVKQYAHFSNPQRRWAWNFLTQYPYQGDESVLDIGSADGNIAANLSKLIRKGQVTGIDLSPKMVNWSKKQYHSQDYPNLHFLVGSVSSLGQREAFDIILSFYTLSFSSHPIKALMEMKQHLKPSGRILIAVPSDGNSAFRDAMVEIKQLEKWKKYWGKSSPRTRWGTEDYRKFLKEAGLKIIRLNKVESIDPFVDKNEFIEWIKLILPPVFQDESMKNEFCSSWIEKYVALRKDAKTSDGVYYGFFNHLEIEAVAE